MKEIFGKLNETCPRKVQRTEAVAVGATIHGHNVTDNGRVENKSVVTAPSSCSGIPKPVVESDEFYYVTSDTDRVIDSDSYIKRVRSSGYIGIITDEEAEFQVLREVSDDFNANFVVAFRGLQIFRRLNTEEDLPAIAQRNWNLFRRGRDHYIFENDRRYEREKY